MLIKVNVTSSEKYCRVICMCMLVIRDNDMNNNNNLTLVLSVKLTLENNRSDLFDSYITVKSTYNKTTKFNGSLD